MKWIAKCKLDGNILFEAEGKSGDIATEDRLNLKNVKRLGNEIYCLHKAHPCKNLSVREHQIEWNQT